MRRLPVVALVLTVLLAACSSGATDDRLGLREVSDPLPRLEGRTVAGGTFGPADYRGAVVVVNAWATWCGPCRREQPALQRAYHRFKDRGVVFVGLNERDDDAAARAWIREFGVGYPSLSDPSGAYARDFDFVGLPDTYVADAGGTMRYAIVGQLDEDELISAIEDVLARANVR
jgi:thiol-disulfide isomerase/thioredoxin